MLAHIHVTYPTMPTEKGLSFKIKEAINALVYKDNVHFKKQIFSSEKYNGPANDIASHMKEFHCDGIISTDNIRMKLECLPDDNSYPVKYYETHFEIEDHKQYVKDLADFYKKFSLNKYSLFFNDIKALHSKNIAYSYSYNADGTTKHILTVRHKQLVSSINDHVISVSELLGLKVTKHYSERVVMDTNFAYDQGWAPLVKFNHSSWELELDVE